MLRRLLSTRNDPAIMLVRLALGIVFFPHGAQKMLGWFGGSGFAATMHYFTANAHIPAVFAFLAICAEFFGSIGLILGFLSRIAAFGICVNMLVAIATVHHKFGFFMNWTGKQPGEGFEFHLLAIGIAVAVMIRGAGAASLDLLFSRRAQ